MTREELRDYVKEQRSLDIIPYHVYSALIDGIDTLEQEPRWIPVSERLPNLDDFSGSRIWQEKVLITGYFSFDDTKELFVSEAFADDVILDHVLNTVIVAWMPKPQPYREVEG